ncbi:MAG: DUF2817 domain-containing protein [Planctomycetota bacterium]
MSDQTPNTRPLALPLLVTACVLVFGTVFLAILSDSVWRSESDAAQTDSPPAVVISPGSEPLLQPPLVLREQIGSSVLGRPLDRVVIGDGPEMVLFLASIHGNEAAGTPLLQRLERHLLAAPEWLAGRTIVLLPLVNPDGMAEKQRYNARDIDLNRNFPAENRQNTKRFGFEALSEPEAVAVYRTIEAFPPTHIVTLHEPLNCVDYDGPAADLAAALSAVCPLPVKKLGSRPGSLGSYAGVTLGIPTITFELPRNARDLNDDQLWALYGNALLTAVTWNPSLAAEPLSNAYERNSRAAMVEASDQP